MSTDAERAVREAWDKIAHMLFEYSGLGALHINDIRPELLAYRAAAEWRALEQATDATNEGMCELCSHTAPDHWDNCELGMTYWRLCALTQAARKRYEEVRK